MKNTKATKATKAVSTLAPIRKDQGEIVTADIPTPIFGKVGDCKGLLGAFGELPTFEGEVAKVDSTFRVVGSIRKGKDSERAATCSSLNCELVGELLAAMGCTREASLAKALQILQNGEKTERGKAWAVEFKATVAKTLPPISARGPLTGNLEFERLA